MTAPASTPAVPRRDAHGRVVSLTELLGVVVLLAAVNAIGLVAIDGLITLLGSSSFGDSSGWLIVILPGLLFFDDFRAWRAHQVRYLAALVSAAAAIGLGLVAAGLAGDLPPMVSGGIGAIVALLTYAPLWFLGIRWLTGDRMESA
jgi:hypothetical protein